LSQDNILKFRAINHVGPFPLNLTCTKLMYNYADYVVSITVKAIPPNHPGPKNKNY